MFGYDWRAVGFGPSAVMVLRADTDGVGAGSGTVQARTYRERLAQRATHGLVMRSVCLCQ
jgi:hypothetical protein